MGESSSHIRLVEQLSSWILCNLLGGDHGCMMIDHPSGNITTRPPKIGGFVPDIYVHHGANNSLIIGEAKTGRDLETRHSLDQLDAFLGRCSQYENAMFILAVPWDMARLAEAIIRQLQNRSAGPGKHAVITKVLEKLSG